MRFVAIGFDVGNTLLTGNLNWKSSYRPALAGVCAAYGITPTEDRLAKAQAVLSKYNTREHPRVVEVTADIVFREILSCWGLDAYVSPTPAVDAFFSFFRHGTARYEDAEPLLSWLRLRAIRIGVLSDLPYGMPEELLVKDLVETHLYQYFDAVLASTTVGFRKPAPNGFLQLSRVLHCPPDAMVYVGDEPKDVQGANGVGIYSVLLDRDGTIAPCGERLRIRNLGELKAHLTDGTPSSQSG